MSSLWTLNSRDLLKGLVVAVLGAILSALQTLVSNKGFDLTKTDLFYILSVALTSMCAYLAKNLLQDENGKLGGKF